MKIVPESLIRTCTACPSQWEGVTTDNRPVYIRFRGDNFKVIIGEPNQSQKDMFFAPVFPKPTLLIPNLTGEPLNGYLDNQEMHLLLIRNDLSSNPSYIMKQKRL